MDAFWKSDRAKLFLGGCGTQVGVLVAVGVVIGTVLVCSFCALSGGLSVALTQTLVNLPAEVTAEAASNEEAEALRGQIESLVAQVRILEASQGGISREPAAPPPTPQPFVIAHQSGVTLRSGPGLNYPGLGTLTLGARVAIVGRNNDSSWWLVSTPGGLGWVRSDVVVAYDVNEDIPIVTIPALLTLPATGAAPDAASAGTPTPAPPSSAAPGQPAGTPTASIVESRISVEDTVGYKRIFEQLSNTPPNSASFSPKGDRIAVMDGIGLYLVAGDGSYGQVLLTEDETIRPVGGAVWSPDGEFIAFMVERKDCNPCRSVGLIRVSDGTISYLKTPDNQDCEAPRWTHDGRLLVVVHPGEPADGVTYVYSTSSRGQPASGIYVLSSSNEGQKWLPWLPGRVWQAGVSERPDTYYN
ncbi:MAG: hypothetical protein Kow0063_15860 [Anaerolineae bacterium]